jgi:hypothetical protein
MAETFVMCPDCGLQAQLSRGDDPIPDPKGKCKHKQNPATCPVLSPAVAAIRQVLKEDRPH